jgi:hypothetical protein
VRCPTKAEKGVLKQSGEKREGAREQSGEQQPREILTEKLGTEICGKRIESRKISRKPPKTLITAGERKPRINGMDLI